MTPHRAFLANAIHMPLHELVDELLDEDRTAPCDCETVPDDQDFAVVDAILDALHSAGLAIGPDPSSSDEPDVRRAGIESDRTNGGRP